MKKRFVVLAVLLVLVGGFWAVRPVYRHWRETLLMARAQAFLGQRDYRNAALSARQALDANPSSTGACRIMAQISDAFRSPLALPWWQRVVELEPHVLSNRLDLARSALLQGDYAHAAQALQGVDKTNENTVAFHQMAAMVALGQNNIGLADLHFGAAAELEPTNKLVQLNQAIIHLQAKDQRIVDGAFKTLEQLYSDPTYHTDALRHLAMAALRNKDFAKAEAFTRELQASPQAPLADRLLHLAVLKEGGHTNFSAYLAELEVGVVTNLEDAHTLAAWLLAHEMTEEAARWLETLPGDVRKQQPVLLALADVYSARRDWAGLQTLLQDANWGGLDYLRLAMLAHACREQRQEIAADTNWRAAIKAASSEARPLAALARMVTTWGWDKEKEELLWLVVQRFPGERWALQSLNQLYLATANTYGLQKLYSTLVEYDANDIAAKNNLAAVLLLLNMQTSKACDMARAAYNRTPGNPAFASTYAYSLHLQGKTREGLKVLAALTPSQLENPSIAIYYGVMLLAADEPAKAKKYLELAETGQLLPEEKALLAAAKKAL